MGRCGIFIFRLVPSCYEWCSIKKYSTNPPMKYILLLALGLALSLPLHAEDTKDSAGDKPKATPEENFKKKDKNSDGFLSLEEFIGKMEGEKKTKGETKFGKKDSNKDSKLSLEEFSAKSGQEGDKKSE